MRSESFRRDGTSEFAVAMVPPEQDEEEAEEHAAEVGKVCHARLDAIDTGKEFESTVADDQPLGFEWHRWNEEEDLGIGEHHAERQQDAEHRTRGTDGNQLVQNVHDAVNFQELGMGHVQYLLTEDVVGGKLSDEVVQFIAPGQLLNETGADARDEIVEQETLFAPNHLQQSSEHVEREHVVEEVRQVAVHEHVSDQLPPVELLGVEIMQPEHVAERDAATFQQAVGQQQDDVDDDEVEGDIGSGSTREICHS